MVDVESKDGNGDFIASVRDLISVIEARDLSRRRNTLSAEAVQEQEDPTIRAEIEFSIT